MRELDPAINAVVVRDSPDTRLALPDRPTMTFSPAAIRHCPSRPGRIFCGHPLGKSEEYIALAKAGMPVPKWVLLTEGAAPDLSGFADYVVQKPDFGGMAEEVRLIRKEHAGWRPITTHAAGESPGVVVQEFIYTGDRPVSFRVNTLFGRVLYSIKQQAPADHPVLSGPDDSTSAETRAGVSIAPTLPGSGTELNFDEEIILLGEHAHAAFPDIPLLGFDIVREVPSGRLSVLEANAIGYVWHMHAAQLAAHGFLFEDQFDGVRKAAYMLAEKTQQHAR